MRIAKWLLAGGFRRRFYEPSGRTGGGFAQDLGKPCGVRGRVLKPGRGDLGIPFGASEGVASRFQPGPGGNAASRG